MTATAYERILDRLRDQGKKVRQTGNQAQAQCPAHDDSNPSLSIKASTGQALIYCWGGCDTTDILAALSLTMSELYDNPKGAAYTYDDGRVVKKTPNKRFYQSGNTKSTPTLYKLSKVQSAVFDGRAVWLTEGEKDADAIESIGGVATTAPMGAKNFHKVDVSPLTGATVKAIVDNDDAGKEWQQQVSQKLKGVAGSLEFYRAKIGKDAADHITAGYTLDEFESLSPKPIALSKARAIFKRWLGDDYDTHALDAMLAAAAVERLDGDPVWLLIISGSGNAKTEAVRALSGIDALVVSTITSEGALLSATEKRQKAKDDTGGLLREIGGRGVLVIKDFTSILSMNRDLRAQVLGALREVHDGSWVRKVGSEGGRSLPWEGRVTIIGAVTTAWDTHHAVVSSMGDRFVLLRVDSKKGRIAAGRQAIDNTSTETQMREELAAAVAGVIAGMETTGTTLSGQETDIVLAAADLVTLARTGVEYDYQGNVIDAHAPEMPTRFAKELTQIIRGAVAVGMSRRDALRLAIRCARDSMPPLRLAIIDDLAGNAESTTSDVQRRLNKPWKTVDRQLQSLNMLEVLDVVEKPWGEERHRWHYSLASLINPTALDPESLPDLESSPQKSVRTPNPHKKRDERREEGTETPQVVTDKSGEDSAPRQCQLCGNPLVWPDSQQRGTCSTCWVHDEDGAA
jgi:hypothetical protein